MRAYESGALSGPEGAPARLAIGINDGPYRLRTASDATWAPTYGYSSRITTGRRVADAARSALRTVVPVLGLTAAQAALFLYMATPVPYLSGTAEDWMRISTLLLPVPPQRRGDPTPAPIRPQDAPAIVHWKQRMQTPDAQAVYRTRAGVIERRHADVRTHRGWTRFLVRGLAKVHTIALWMALAQNAMRTMEIIPHQMM